MARERQWLWERKGISKTEERLHSPPTPNIDGSCNGPGAELPPTPEVRCLQEALTIGKGGVREMEGQRGPFAWELCVGITPELFLNLLFTININKVLLWSQFCNF